MRQESRKTRKHNLVPILFLLGIPLFLGTGCSGTRNILSSEESSGETKNLKGNPDAIWEKIMDLSAEFRQLGYEVRVDPERYSIRAIKIQRSSYPFRGSYWIVDRVYEIYQRGNDVTVQIQEIPVPYARYRRERRNYEEVGNISEDIYQNAPGDLLNVDGMTGLGDRFLGRDYSRMATQAREDLMRGVFDTLQR